MKALLAIALLVCSIGLADAQVIKLTGTQVVNADGSVTPTLTWCTETTASSGTTCSNVGPASACTASGGWTGAKAGSGTQAQPKITSTTSYFLSCVWPGQDKITVTWSPPTTNDDGSVLNDLAGFHIYYGQSASMSVNQVLDVKGAGITSAVLGPGLAPGDWFIVASAYNSGGVESRKVPVPPLQKTLTSGATVGQAFKVTFPGTPTNVAVQ